MCGTAIKTIFQKSEAWNFYDFTMKRALMQAVVRQVLEFSIICDFPRTFVTLKIHALLM
jgi:hypothetical protein